MKEEEKARNAFCFGQKATQGLRIVLYCAEVK